VDRIPPRPSGYGMHRELFPRYTGSTFDAISPAVVASSLTVSQILEATRAARIVEQRAVDPSLPGLEEIIDKLFAGTFGARAANPYEAEVKRAVERVVIDNLTDLAASARMPQVRAIATLKLQQRMTAPARPQLTDAEFGHTQLLAADIKRFLERPSAPATRLQPPVAPPGAPIGDFGLDWLGRFELRCWWADDRMNGIKPD